MKFRNIFIYLSIGIIICSTLSKVVAKESADESLQIKESDTSETGVDTLLVKGETGKQSLPEVPVSTYKYNPEIDRLLNIEDTSIFSNNRLKEFKVEEIHPRSIDYYNLIRNISILDSVLFEIAVNIKKIDEINNSIEKEPELSTSTLEMLTKRSADSNREIKTGIKQAKERIDIINKETNDIIRKMMPEALREYYISLVRDRYLIYNSQ
jgi:hypothetical protein